MYFFNANFSPFYRSYMFENFLISFSPSNPHISLFLACLVYNL